jgi:hypothetical protein
MSLTKEEEALVRKHLPRLIGLGMRRHELAGMLSGLLMSGQPTERRPFPVIEEIYRLEARVRADEVSSLLMRAAQAMLAGQWAEAKALFDRVDDVEGRPRQ